MSNISVTTVQSVINVTETGGITVTTPEGQTIAVAVPNSSVNVTNTTDNITVLTNGTLIIQSPDTYSIQADTATGGGNLTLVNSNGTTDAVKFASGTGIAVSRTDASTITITNTVPDTNTTYTIDSSTISGGANLNLVGSDSTTDSVAYKGSGATTVSRIDASTITISSTDTNTTYTQNASAATGGANLNLVGSDSTTDSVKFAQGTGISVVRTDADTITITNTVPDTNTTYTIASDATTGGANLTLTGSDSTTDSVAYKGSGATTITSTDANTITVSSTDTNTTYTQNASSTTGGANLNLVGSDSTTDSVKFAGSGATTITRTDADTITVSSTDTNTTYTQNASTTSGGANLNLVGSDSTTDSVKFASGTGITVSRTDADTITITNSDPGSAGVTSITGTTNQVIASASTGAITLSTPQDIATSSNPTFNNLAINGGSLTTTNTTANLVNANATTLNLGGAATTTNIGATINSAVTNINNNLKMNREGSLIFSLPNYNGTNGASTSVYDATRRFYSTFSITPFSGSISSGDGTTATLYFTPVGALNGVQIVGTAGQFQITNIYGNTIFTIGQAIYVTGTLSGTGTITGYTNPKTYYIIATNGSTTFTLSATLGGAAITTTAGTTTGLTFSNPEYTPPFYVGAKILVGAQAGTVSAFHGVQTVTACTFNSVSYLSSATGTYSGGGTITLYEPVGIQGISLSNADTFNDDTWLNFRTYGSESTNTPGGQSIIQYETTRGTVNLPLPPQNTDFLGSFYLQTNLGSGSDATIAGTRTITTAASGTGSIATLTYASTGAAPYTTGTWITVTGVIPAAYNGTYQIISASATQITYYSSATGSMTQAGFITQLWTSIGSTAGTTAAMNMTTDMFRFPPQQFAAQATENHRMINLGTFTGAATTAGILTVSGISTTSTTAAAGSGTQATLTFAANSTNSPPFAPGTLINVEGVTPTGYNGTYQVLTCTSTQVTYISTTTGSQTVAGTIKAYIANGIAYRANTATTPLVRSSPAMIFAQLTSTNANGLLGAEGTYTIGGVPTPIAYTDTCTYYTFAAGMGMAYDQAARSRVYNPSTRVRTLSLTPEITEFSSGQFGFGPQPYIFTDNRKLLAAITGGNTLNIPYHGLKVGDTVSPNGNQSGLTGNTPYYVATIVDVNNITLASDSALTTAVTGLTNGSGLNRVMYAFTNPTSFNMNLRNFRAGWNTQATSVQAIPNVLNDQIGSITFSGNRTGSIASQFGGSINAASGQSIVQSQAAAITAQATADWTATSTPSKLVLATTAVSSVTPTTTLSLSNSNSNIASDTITLESSAGTDYAVLDANTAKFNVPVATELTTTTINEGTTYTPAATVDNNISVQINTLSGGTTVIDLINLTGNSRGASYNILVFNNTASGTPIQVKNTRINTNNLMTHTITTGNPRIIINAYVVGDYATATHLVVA